MPFGFSFGGTGKGRREGGEKVSETRRVEGNDGDENEK